MLRGDTLVCGTSTTGTGTLTLAATPTPPGGVDFDVWARATGIGFANSAAVLVSYTIIEYTDATFATAKSHEKGIGTLTLGGSSGITNCTLARTTKQTTATSLNSQPATQNIAPANGFSIGTAANTLVFIGPSAADVPAFSPYVVTSAIGGDTFISPLCSVATISQVTPTLNDGTFYYVPFIWTIPMLVKRAHIFVDTAYSGGTPVSNAWMRLYDFATTGKPGKLLYDFGLVGSANTSLNSVGHAQTGASGNGFFLTPGDYVICLAVAVSGGSAGPILSGTRCYVNPGRWGTMYTPAGVPLAAPWAAATGSPSSTPDDPAGTTSLSVDIGGSINPLCFCLTAS